MRSGARREPTSATADSTTDAAARIEMAHPFWNRQQFMETRQAAETAETFESEIGHDQETMVIPVIEEQAFLNKRVIETGKVRISKRVVKHEEAIDVPLFHEEVSVERVPINQYVDAEPEVRHEGNVMIIPVVREQLVMKKQLILVEELRVKKQVVETHQSHNVTLRKEEIDIRRIAANEKPGD